MRPKLVLVIELSVTTESLTTDKYYVDPDEIRANDRILVECPRGIDPKALDVSKIIQGALPGIIEEHNALRGAEIERLMARNKPGQLALGTVAADGQF